jgi:hypothetical protein
MNQIGTLRTSPIPAGVAAIPINNVTVFVNDNTGTT